MEADIIDCYCERVLLICPVVGIPFSLSSLRIWTGQTAACTMTAPPPRLHKFAMERAGRLGPGDNKYLLEKVGGCPCLEDGSGESHLKGMYCQSQMHHS